MFLWIANAVAAPAFDGEREHVELAERAWPAATACAGWEAPHADTVTIEVGAVTGGFAGMAYTDTLRGLHHIELSERAVARTVLHEVAHAWVHRGPPGLVEGRTNLLADCVARTLEIGDLARDDRRWLSHMESLVDWENGGDAEADDRHDGYTASLRFFRVMAEYVPERELYPALDFETWALFRAAFAGRSPEVDALLAILDRDADWQMRALSDEDRDGILAVVEVLHGTDPTKRDTDGDGLPDGVTLPPMPSGAVFLPADGQRHCTGWQHPPGAEVSWVFGTTKGHRTGGRPLYHSDDGALVEVPRRDQWVPASYPIWALPLGEGVERATRCLEDPQFLLEAASTKYEPLLEAVRPLLSDTQTSRRFVVRFGGDDTFAPDESLYLGDDDLDAAGTPEAVAALIEAWRDGSGAFRDALAALRAVPPPPPPPPVPDTAAVLPAGGGWHCSGWRLTPGGGPFEVDREEGRQTQVLEARDPHARVVRSVGSAARIWSTDPAARPDAGCAERGEVVLLDAPTWARGPLLEGLTTPMVVQLEAPHTGAAAGVVTLSEAHAAWARKTKRWDVLVGLCEILASYADMGVAPTSAAVNDELAIGFGEGVLEVELGR